MNVFLFVSADADKVGLSLLADGSNLPAIPGGGWKPHAAIFWSQRDIGRYTADIELAMMHLRTRGYFHACRTATVMPFPQTHRQSS